MQRQCMTNN